MKHAFVPNQHSFGAAVILFLPIVAAHLRTDMMFGVEKAEDLTPESDAGEQRHPRHDPFIGIGLGWVAEEFI